MHNFDLSKLKKEELLVIANQFYELKLSHQLKKKEIIDILLNKLGIINVPVTNSPKYSVRVQRIMEQKRSN